MTSKMLTTSEIEARLSAARERERRARAAKARLERQLVVTDRRLAAQQKITLGAALLRLAETEPRHVDALRRLLTTHITRDCDRACLRNTPFAVDEPPDVSSGDADSGGAA